MATKGPSACSPSLCTRTDGTSVHTSTDISCAWGNVVVYEVLPRHDFCWLKTIFKTPQAVRKYSRVNFFQRDHSVLPLPFTIHTRSHSQHFDTCRYGCCTDTLLAKPASRWPRYTAALVMAACQRGSRVHLRCVECTGHVERAPNPNSSSVAWCPMLTVANERGATRNRS